MKIHARIFSLQILMAFFIILTMFTFSYLAEKLEGEFDAMEYETIPVSHLLAKIQANGLGIFSSTNRILFGKYVLGQSPQEEADTSFNLNSAHELDELEGHINDFNRNLAAFQQLSEQFFPEDTQTIEQIRQLGSGLIELSQRLLVIPVSQDNIKDIQELERKYEIIKHQFDGVVRGALDLEASKVSAHHEKLEESIGNIELESRFGGVLLLFVVVVLGRYISRSIVDPIRQISECTKKTVFKVEDLQTIGERKDEIGELALSFLSLFNSQNRIKSDALNQANFHTSLIKAIPSPIFFKNVDGHYLGCNRAFEQFLGRPLEEIIHKTVYDLAPQEQADIYFKADQALFDQPGSQIYEASVMTPDKGRRHVVFHKATYLDQSGQVAGLVGAILDISDRKAVEERLETELEFFEGVVESLPGLFYLFDTKEGLVRWNRNMEREAEYTASEMRGKGPLAFIPPEDRPMVENRIMEVFSSGYSSADSYLYSRTGKKIPYFFTGSTITRQGHTFMVGMGINTSEIKSMEQELRLAMERAEEASRTKSEFLAHMSHDIRTPMNAILGMGEMLAESKLDGIQKQQVQIINHAGEHLLALINDILDLSKIEADQLELESIPFNPRSLAESTLAILNPKAKSRGIGMVGQFDETLPEWVLGDPQRVQQIMLNLLSNSVKFTEQGTITLIIEQVEKGRLRFRIIDTGVGIPQARQQTIFQPFVQADRSTARRFGGSGLGLSICQKLVEQMLGSIWVESEPGVGSTFFVDIPFQEAPAKKEPQQDVQPRGFSQKAVTSAGLNILLADDAEENCLVVEAYLRATPHRLTIVEDGAKALQTFKQGGFDLVLMDIHMPKMGGHEATQAIREWEKSQDLPHTPIFALTANAMKEDIEKTRESGCNLHLSKPIRKGRLLEAIDHFHKLKTESG
ncbi:MAG: PAS domain S-box protein [Magnetococcales bacterium]|nr:PAS domain S-box protein [Magnetococcales bacterium]